MLHNCMHLRRSAIAGVQCTVAVLDTTEASQQSEAAANEDECQALRDDSRSLSKSLEHKSLGTLRRRGTTSWSMEDDSKSSGWIRSQVGLHLTPEKRCTTGGAAHMQIHCTCKANEYGTAAQERSIYNISEAIA